MSATDVPGDTVAARGFSAVLSEVIGLQRSPSLRFTSASAEAFEGRTVNESHIEPTIATVVWEILAESPAYSRTLLAAGASPEVAARARGRTIVVVHGVMYAESYDLLVLDPERPRGMITSAAVDASVDELERGWQRWQSLHAGEPITELVGPDLAPVALNTKPFVVVVAPAPSWEPMTAPSPPWGVAVGAGANAASTAGVMAVDGTGRAGVTIARHAITPVFGTPVWVNGMAGTLVSEDQDTDSSFVELPHLAGQALPPLMALCGESPGTNERVSFSGFATKPYPKQTVVNGWDFSVIYLRPHRSPRVYTPPVTMEGDSGAALVSERRGYLLGFSSYRTGLDEATPASEWAWSASVCMAHNLATEPIPRGF